MRRCSRALCATFLALLTSSTAARAQAPARCDAPLPIVTTGWRGPLGRTVTLHASDVTLGEALTRLATAAGIRFSYSSESLPLARRVCLSYAGAPVGAVLAELLRGAHVEAVVAGADHVVLAATRAAAAEARHAPEQPVVTLDRLLVRGRTPEAELRAAPAGNTVITGRDLAQRNVATLADALNGAVPGLWLWGRSVSGASAEYGSLRGVSSFSGGAPKVYLDGIELASPLLLDRISADAIERIEIIRGPQGAALHGANALAGVINIVTRHVVEDGTRSARVHTGVGIAASDFASGTQVVQQHGISVAAGTRARSATLNLSLGTLGDYVPGAATQHMAADATGRLVGERAIVTAKLRFLTDRTGIAASPLLPDSLWRASGAAQLPDSGAAQRTARQYTGGITASYRHGAAWTHSVVAGIDGFERDGVSQSHTDAATPLQDVLTGALRLSVRVSAERRFRSGDHAQGTLTLSAERSLLQEHGFTTGLETYTRTSAPRPDSGISITRAPVVRAPAGFHESSSNSGLTAHSTVGWHERFFLSGGVRLDRNSSVFDVGRWAALPMIGATGNWTAGPLALRLRSAWGKGIRWSSPPAAQAHFSGDERLQPLDQLAEEQTGIEAGADVMFADVLTLRVTRFDQTATALTRERSAAEDGMRGPGRETRPRAPLGVGQIDNDGWELQASLESGALSVVGTLALVDSRVRALTQGYTGELRPGDRMLAVPARTGSVTLSWNGGGWSASATAARAADWINYDRLALLTAASTSADPLTGAELRSFWLRYDGVTHLRASLGRQLGRGMLLTVTGDNLLDVQLGEPDNITVRPGRVLSLGVRASF